MNEAHIIHRDAEVTQLFAQAAPPSEVSRFTEQFEFALIRDRRRRRLRANAIAMILLVAALIAAPLIASATIALADLIIHGRFGVVDGMAIALGVFAVLVPTVWFVRVHPWLK
jgi:hypothetical protein